VQTDVVVPSTGISAANQNRVLINLHGGGFAVAARYGGQSESVPVAGTGQVKVITVDYRMAPEHRFPAASEDVAKVYAELLKSYRPENVGIYGCSAGADLTAESVAWFQTHGLPRPGAISMMGGSAVVDHSGDSNYVSAALGGYPMPAISPVVEADDYFAGANLSDPMISPAHYDSVMKEFPPSQFINGIRDATLSGALYTHSRLVDLGVDADLHVWEGAAHCFPTPESPEGRQAFRLMTRFFDRHLGTKAK
jgi:monoterpene epsilon-lactone hydrolase